MTIGSLDAGFTAHSLLLTVSEAASALRISRSSAHRHQAKRQQLRHRHETEEEARVTTSPQDWDLALTGWMSCSPPGPGMGSSGTVCAARLTSKRGAQDFAILGDELADRVATPVERGEVAPPAAADIEEPCCT